MMNCGAVACATVLFSRKWIRNSAVARDDIREYNEKACRASFPAFLIRTNTQKQYGYLRNRFILPKMDK